MRTPLLILMSISSLLLAAPARGAECELVGKDLCRRPAGSTCECPAIPVREKLGCDKVIFCFGFQPVGAFPNCRCPTCEMDHACTFPDLPSGKWPDCVCLRPEPVSPNGLLDPCQAACAVGTGTGTWPSCVCTPSNSCNPFACPPGTEMTGKPPLCHCEEPKIQPPPT